MLFPSFNVSSLAKSCLFVICAVGWLMQSLPALFLYMEGADIVKQRSVPAQHLALPHLLFCNRFPFTQAGLASLGAQFNRDFVLAYLRQWLDPSVGVGLPDDAMPSVAQLSAEDRATAEATIAQLLPNGRLKQRLEQLMPQCQDMVSSCVLHGHQMSGFDCCRMVEPWLATPKAGICWPFVANSSASSQSPLDNARGIQITFQISRNSFHSTSAGGALSVHPGLSVHLVSPNLAPAGGGRLRVATSFDSTAQAHSLADKRSLRLDIRKEIVAADSSASFFTPTNGLCSDVNAIDGAPPSSADHVKNGATHSVSGSANAAVGGLLCLLEKAIEQCSCVPMIVVLWTLQGDLDSTFLRHFNASTICTVMEFDHCVHPFVEFAMPPAWDFYPTPSEAGTELRAAVDTCRKGSPRVCQRENFPARSKERDLPPEYQNTQDFVSRLSVSFDSFLVTEMSAVKEMDMHKLLATFGYNLWWFAIGHLLWTVCRFRFCHLSSGDSLTSNGTKGNNNKVSPKSPMVPTTVAPAATHSMANGTNANGMSADSSKIGNNNNTNAVQNAAIVGGGSVLSSPFVEQPPKMGVYPLSPPRALPRSGARQLPPLTIGGGNAENGEMTTMTAGEGGGEHTNPCFASAAVAAGDEPPQRRRRGPKLALDELEG